MKKKIGLCLLALGLFALAFNACKDDDGPGTTTNTSTGMLTDTDKAYLYDKPWYSTSASGGITHEFFSDNTLRLSKSLDGRWNWIHNGDTMDLLDHQFNRFYYVFKDITEHSMSFTSNVDGFKTIASYRDTE